MQMSKNVNNDVSMNPSGESKPEFQPRSQGPLSSPQEELGSFSKPRQLWRRKRRQTKGLICRTIAVHARFKSLYVSLPFSAKQQREITKLYVFWRTGTAMADFWKLLLELNRCRCMLNLNKVLDR